MEELEFEQLYRRHAPAVRAYVARRHRDVDEALAEIWLVAWRRRDALPDEALPWLYGTARRVLANQRRGARRLLGLRERLARETSGPSLELPERELAGALNRLSEADREALLLTAWEGLDAARAAAAMGCSAAAFNSRLHRARARLRLLLAEQSEITEVVG